MNKEMNKAVKKGKAKHRASNLRKLRVELLVVVILFVALFGSFYMAYAAEGNGYRPTGTCTIKVGDSVMTVRATYAGDYDKLKTAGQVRNEFFKTTRQIKLSSTFSKTNPYGLKLVKNDNGQYIYNTRVDAGGDLSTIVFKITFTLPAHYTVKSQSVTGCATDTVFKFINDDEKYQTESYAFPGKASHHTSDQTVTFKIRLNLKNSGMLDDGFGDFHSGTLSVTPVKDKYTATFKDSLRGNSTASCLDGTTYTMPSPSLSGYKFNGWKEGTNVYAAGSKYSLCTKDRTFEAQWTPYTHNVVYDLQGGKFPSDKKSQTTLNNCKIIPNGTYYIQSGLNANRYVHVKGKYMEARNNAIVTYDGYSGDQTKWIFERYNDTQYYYITSVLNGLALELNGSPTSSNKLTDKGVELYYQNQPADDYLWYLKDTGDGKVNIYNKSSGQVLDIPKSNDSNDVIIGESKYTGANNQKFKMISAEQNDYPSRKQYGNHNIYVNSLAPEKDNSTFFFWNTKPDGTGATYKAGSVYSAVKDGGTVTLYAIWNVDNFTISFNANGGIGSISSITHKGFDSFTLPRNTFTRKGYVFRGWSLEKYPDKASYKDGAVYDNQTPNATLYAQWQRSTAGFIQRPFLDAQMFFKNSALVGENGTIYNKDLIDSRMAHIDDSSNPGYFSNGWNK